MTWTVTQNPERQRFECEVDGALALCSYRQEGRTLVLHHTEVPVALEGRGIAAALVKTTLDWARQERLQVRPLCSYVALYMRRHPQTLDLLDPSL